MNHILVSNLKTDRIQPGYTAIYCGRGRAPAGMEAANLGNPFVVGPQYQQGEAAAAYLPYLRERYRARGREYRTLMDLARRAAGGEKLQLFCWVVRRGPATPNISAPPSKDARRSCRGTGHPATLQRI